jgi:hypothetical protein
MLKSAMMVICLLAAQMAAPPVRTGVPAQKFRTFFSENDPAVPRALLAGGPAGPAVAGATAWARTSDGAIWIGTATGLVRFDAAGQQVFTSRRYLPDDHVVSLYAEGLFLWVRTRTGVSRIEFRPMTLEQKADLFEQRVRDRHDRDGQVADSILRVAGDLSTNQMVSNDNDGLWTAMYAAGKLFEHSVRRTPAALAAARKSIRAVLRLEGITGRPGFPARSIIRKDEPQPKDGEWHEAGDGSGARWKGDTSSDEIVGHFFLYGLAWDLLPPSEKELRTEVAGTARRVMDHIIEHRYNLTDTDGKPTTWGRWDWEYFNSQRGKPDGPLNALEVLAFLKTAHHITGDAKYAAEYERLAIGEKYLAHAGRYLELREEINYSDEELAMLPFYLVFRYEKDPAYLRGYRAALEQWWANAQREKNPLWTFIYLTANPGAKVDLAGAVETLARIPMDLVKWSYDNSARPDIEFDPELERFRRPQSRNLFPPDERAVMKWNGNPFRLDGGNGGFGEDDGGFFILPYWLGRNHGFLTER